MTDIETAYLIFASVLILLIGWLTYDRTRLLNVQDDLMNKLDEANKSRDQYRRQMFKVTKEYS